MNLNLENSNDTIKPTRSYFSLPISQILGKSYCFISNTLSQAIQLIQNIFAKAVAWTKSWFGVNSHQNTQSNGQIPSSLNPVVGNEDVVDEIPKVKITDKISKVNVPQISQKLSKISVQNIDKPIPVARSVPEEYSEFSGLLVALTDNYCLSFSEHRNADLHARKFFIDFEDLVREFNLSKTEKIKWIVQIAIRRKEIEDIISKYIKPISSNRVDDAKPEYFNDLEVRELTKHLFGINFAYFIVENAPIDNLESLPRYMKIFEGKDIFTEHDSVQIFSDILSRLYDLILSSPFKFKTLKSQIEFIENQVKNGIQISKERIELETLAIDYDSDESEEEEVLDEKFDVSAVISNFNIKNIHALNNIQENVLNTLRKRAALSRLEEYHSSEFDPVTFLEMLLETEGFLGEIDVLDRLYVPLQEAFDRNTMKYSDHNTVYDMLAVTRIVEPHSRLAKKLGVAPLSGNTVAIIPDVDNDKILAKMYQQEENAASIHADHLLARHLAGY